MAKDDDPAYTLVEADHEAYRIMDELVARYHNTLSEARISLVWAHKIKADRDGHMKWGEARKVNAHEKLYHDHDFSIVLNAAVWQELPDNARIALIDHELSHCGSKTDDEGEVSYHLIKHDLEEFIPVVKRHGLWRDSIEATVKAALEHKEAAERGK